MLGTTQTLGRFVYELENESFKVGVTKEGQRDKALALALRWAPLLFSYDMTELHTISETPRMERSATRPRDYYQSSRSTRQGIKSFGF